MPTNPIHGTDNILDSDSDSDSAINGLTLPGLHQRGGPALPRLLLLRLALRGLPCEGGSRSARRWSSNTGCLRALRADTRSYGSMRRREAAIQVVSKGMFVVCAKTASRDRQKERKYGRMKTATQTQHRHTRSEETARCWVLAPTVVLAVALCIEQSQRRNAPTKSWNTSHTSCGKGARLASRSSISRKVRCFLTKRRLDSCCTEISDASQHLSLSKQRRYQQQQQNSSRHLGRIAYKSAQHTFTPLPGHVKYPVRRSKNWRHSVASFDIQVGILPSIF